MKTARFNQETRDFIEGLFEHQNYDIDRQIFYLELRERQMWHYNMDCPGCVDNSSWDEIIDMLNERKELARMNKSKIIGFMLLHTDGDKEYYSPELSEKDQNAIFKILEKYGDDNESCRGNLKVIDIDE